MYNISVTWMNDNDTEVEVTASICRSGLDDLVKVVEEMDNIDELDYDFDEVVEGM